MTENIIPETATCPDCAGELSLHRVNDLESAANCDCGLCLTFATELGFPYKPVGVYAPDNPDCPVALFQFMGDAKAWLARIDRPTWWADYRDVGAEA